MRIERQERTEVLVKEGTEDVNYKQPQGKLVRRNHSFIYTSL